MVAGLFHRGARMELITPYAQRTVETGPPRRTLRAQRLQARRVLVVFRRHPPGLSLPLPSLGLRVPPSLRYHPLHLRTSCSVFTCGSHSCRRLAPARMRTAQMKTMRTTKTTRWVGPPRHHDIGNCRCRLRCLVANRGTLAVCELVTTAKMAAVGTRMQMVEIGAPKMRMAGVEAEVLELVWARGEAGEVGVWNVKEMKSCRHLSHSRSQP